MIFRDVLRQSEIGLAQPNLSHIITRGQWLQFPSESTTSQGCTDDATMQTSIAARCGKRRTRVVPLFCYDARGRHALTNHPSVMYPLIPEKRKVDWLLGRLALCDTCCRVFCAKAIARARPWGFRFDGLVDVCYAVRRIGPSMKTAEGKVVVLGSQGKCRSRRWYGCGQWRLSLCNTTKQFLRSFDRGKTRTEGLSHVSNYTIPGSVIALVLSLRTFFTVQLEVSYYSSISRRRSLGEDDVKDNVCASPCANTRLFICKLY